MLLWKQQTNKKSNLLIKPMEIHREKRVETIIKVNNNKEKKTVSKSITECV